MINDETTHTPEGWLTPKPKAGMSLTSYSFVTEDDIKYRPIRRGAIKSISVENEDGTIADIDYCFDDHTYRTYYYGNLVSEQKCTPWGEIFTLINNNCKRPLPYNEKSVFESVFCDVNVWGAAILFCWIVWRLQTF